MLKSNVSKLLYDKSVYQKTKHIKIIYPFFVSLLGFYIPFTNLYKAITQVRRVGNKFRHNPDDLI